MSKKHPSEESTAGPESTSTPSGASVPAGTEPDGTPARCDCPAMSGPHRHMPEGPVAIDNPE
jgi:hypothetical protein